MDGRTIPPREEEHDAFGPDSVKTPIAVRKKRPRDIAMLFRFLMLFLIIFFSMTTIAVFTIGLTLILLLIFCAISLFFTITGGFFVEMFGSRAGGFLAGWSSKKHAKASLAGDLQKARVSKRAGDFEGALRTVNGVLKAEPENPEALFLKATILWEGFENKAAARGYLKKVMELTEIDDHLFTWARDYRDRISEASEKTP